MTLTEHAKYEMDFLKRKFREDDDMPLILEYEKEILALVEKFGDSGQSGGSAPFTASIITKGISNLLNYKPIGAITGAVWEWNDVTGMNGEVCFQNRRLSGVFKEGEDGTPYYLDAIVFQGEDEYDAFTGSVENIYSRQYIKSFPFYPKTFYIDVYKDYDVKLDDVLCEDNEGKHYTYRIKDVNQLEEVFEYYDFFQRGE
jgi:hypothetical protein